MPDNPSPMTGVQATQPTTAGSASVPSAAAQIQPTIRLPLLGVKDGGISWPVVEFNRAGDRVMVVDFYQRFWSWPNLRWHSPDLAVLCVVMAILWTATRAWRNFFSRHGASMVGRWLCRDCAYDLTPPGADPAVRTAPIGIPGRCPECGVQTSRRPPRQFRSRLRRMLAPIVALLLVFGAAVAVLDWTLELAPATPEPVLLWPSPRLSDMLSHALFLPVLQRREDLSGRTDSHVLTMFELPAARAVGRIDGLAGGYADYEFTKDEQWCIAVADSTDGLSHISAIDLRTTPFRAHAWPMPGNGKIRITPGPHDPHAVLMSELARADDQAWWPITPTSGVPTRNIVLKGWSLDIETGRTTRAFEVPVTLDAPGTSRSLDMCVWRSTSADDPAAFTAVLQTAGSRDRLARSSSLRIFSITGRGVQTRDVQCPGRWSLNDRPEPDGFSLPILTETTGGARSWAMLDTRSGAISGGSPTYIWTSPDGLLTFQSDISPPGFRDPSGTLLAMTYDGTFPIQPRIDLNGHWAWSIWQVTPPPRWLVSLAGYRFRQGESIALWDLEPVKQTVRNAHSSDRTPNSPTAPVNPAP